MNAPAKGPEGGEEALGVSLDELAGKALVVVERPRAPFRWVRDLPEGAVPVDWVCEGLLVRGEVALLASRPKVGKSTLARCLAACVLRGEPFLGRRTVEGSVLWVSREEPEAFLRERFGRLGVLDLPVATLDFDALAGPLPAPDELAEAARACGAALAVVDTLQRVLPMRDANDYTEAVRVLSELQEAARACGAAFLVLHHANKRAHEAEDHAQGVMGSAGLFGTAAVLATMGRDARGVWVQTEGRFGQNVPKTYVSLDEETQRLRSEGTAEQAEERELRERALEALAEEPELTRSELRERLGCRGRALAQALAALERDGEVEASGAGRKGDPKRYRIRGEGFSGCDG